jgi:hypothetical protein
MDKQNHLVAFAVQVGAFKQKGFPQSLIAKLVSSMVREIKHAPDEL